MTTKNPILDELHATRERLLQESGGTLSGLIERLKDEQAKSKHPLYKGQVTEPCTGETKTPEFSMKNLSSPPDDR